MRRRWANPRGQSLVTIFAIIGLIFFGPMIIQAYVGALQSRGMDVAKSECEYNPDRYRYELTIVVYNVEPVYKTVIAEVRTRFRPPLGKGWPDRILRQMYRTNSQPITVVFEPNGNIEEKFTYTLPEQLEDYNCSSSVAIIGQRRYKGRPSIEDVDAAPEQIRKGTLYRFRRWMEDR
jgi:hypothetical protein